MKRTEYTGQINETQDRGKGKGHRMIWDGSRYQYLTDCNKTEKLEYILDGSHEFYCEACAEIQEKKRLRGGLT